MGCVANFAQEVLKGQLPLSRCLVPQCDGMDWCETVRALSASI
jgi:hypothetical protein